LNSFWFLVFGFWFLVFGFWFLVFGLFSAEHNFFSVREAEAEAEVRSEIMVVNGKGDDGRDYLQQCWFVELGQASQLT
jgi:hypothetical protein